jgi:hypothetical protein
MKNVVPLLIAVLLFMQVCEGQNTTSARDSTATNEFYSKEFKWGF